MNQIQLIEENAIAYYQGITRLLGGEYHEDDQVTWFVTSRRSLGRFNGVLCTTVRQPEDIGKVVDPILEIFRFQSLPFFWVDWAEVGTPDLGDYLLFKEPSLTKFSIPAMLRGFDDLPQVSIPNEVEITRVQTQQDQTDWLNVLMEGFEEPEPSRPDFGQYLANSLFEPNPVFDHFLARWQGKPCAISTLLRAEHSAGIYHVAALPNYRGHGLGKALTLAPMQSAWQAGYDTAVLFATPSGFPIYQQLGFETVSTADLYAWNGVGLLLPNVTKVTGYFSPGKYTCVSFSKLQKETRMTTFILIHGMWHGGWCWERLTSLLRAEGYIVYPPTLAGLAERADRQNGDIDLNTHVQEIVDLCKTNDLHEVVLVGHSSGGFMAHVIADIIPERIAHIVNLDGMVPENSKSLADLIGETWDFFKKKAVESGDEWWCPPILEWTFGVSGADLEWAQSKLTPHPLKTLTTPVALEDPRAKSIPSTFIRCSEGMAEEDIAIEEKKFAGLGMNFRSLPTGHDAMITMPKELAGVLLELAG